MGNSNILVRGAGPVDGIPALLSLMRVELYGFGSLIEFLYHFQKFQGITDSKSKLVTWIDNHVVIKCINQTRRAWSHWQRICHDANIIIHTMNQMTAMSLKVKLQWVKSHQDKHKSYYELDMAGRMNVDVDAIAENFWIRMQDRKEDII